MDINVLLNDAIKATPVSNRASRKRSSSTSSDIVRMIYNESHYGVPPKTREAIVNATEISNCYPDFLHLR